MERPSKELRVLRFGPFEANFTTGELCKHGIRLKLQDQPFHVLRMLLARPGELVTREEIRQALWPSGTFVDFDNGLNAGINRLREALGDSAEHPRFIETLPRRGYRFICPLDGPAPSAVQPLPPEVRVAGRKLWKILVPSAVILVAAAIGGTFYFRSRQRAIRLTDKDTIVLSDFDNRTGDPVFDDTLKQGLSVQLEQSPFLDLLSDRKVNETLKLMGRSPDDRLTANVTREVCQRTSSKAMLTGSIAGLGSQYVIGLKAVNCNTGDVLAEAQEQAAGKEAVLKALDSAAVSMRSKLGESLSTVQKFDTPLEQATTSSLEALQAYNLGRKAFGRVGIADSVPLFQRAIRLDPSFAMAYAALGTSYFNLGERNLGAENAKKAYELRERVSEREKFYIESHYNVIVTGDLEKARQAYELWAQVYPRDFVPYTNLGGTVYWQLGRHDKALERSREALRLEVNGVNYVNLIDGYLNLNRLDEARATAKEAQAKKFDSFTLHVLLYDLAFLQNDAAGMTQQVDWAGRPFLAEEAATAAYSGRLRKAREFSRGAVASAQKWGKQGAAVYAGVALTEALFGNIAEARRSALSALERSTERDEQAAAAQALALAGDVSRAQALTDDLGKRYPENTVVLFNNLPTLRAQLALDRNDASKAIELLQAAAPYELGNAESLTLYPVYVRGEAYLAAHQGNEGAAEFHKIIDHRGIVRNSPIGALAHLGLARAYVLQGDTAKARAAYQDFLTLWKDADPDIPILKQAKAEYAKLR